MTTDDATAGAPGTEPAPVLRVVRGDPQPDELAALIAVVAATAGATEPAPEVRPATWSAYWRGVRKPVRPAVDGWLSSGRPQ